jgi:GntR family transcriptional repressor for pyruvate dehydrogenase complex
LKPQNVFAHLKEGVLGGRWGPGARLPSERALAEELGASRPSVREALRELSGEGLIEIRPRRGIFVKAAGAEPLGDPFARLIGSDFDRVNELLDLRRVLERRAAALAAEFATPADLAALDDAYRAIEREIGAGGTAEAADARFHCTIATAAGNTVLTHLMTTLHGALARASRLLASRLMVSDHYMAGMAERHAAVYEAIRAHDAKAAAAAMDAHFDFVARELAQYRRKAG